MLTRTMADRHNEAYRRAWSLLSGEIEVEGRQPSRHLTDEVKRKLEEASLLFCKVLEIKPDNWSAMWGLGKISQRLGENEEALGWFKKAAEIAPQNPDVLREASISALRLGKAADGLRFAEASVKLKPEDHGLYANWALALLISGREEEAREKAVIAAKGTPHDKISETVLAFIDSVIARQAPKPRNIGEVEQYIRNNFPRRRE